MEIRILNETEYELSKKLWLECFPEDGEEFVDLYYRERTKPEYVLGAFLHGENSPAAMLHMLPMRMRLNGKERDICFVAGVCTRPGSRRRGICAALFAAAFPIMRARGSYATMLQPFDEGFYERFGYKTFITRKRVKLSAERLNTIVHAYDSDGSFASCEAHPKSQVIPDPELLSELYAAAMGRFEGCSIRDEEYFRGFIEEYSAPGAYLCADERGCCAGYADGNDPSSFTATELFYLEGADPLKLLPPGFSSYTFPLPRDAELPLGCEYELEHFSMIKPLCGEVDEPLTNRASLYGFDRY